LLRHRARRTGERHVTIGPYRSQTVAAAAFLRGLSAQHGVSSFDPDLPPGATPRPKTRADCVDGPRPCPWVSCRHHLAIDVLASGSFQVNFPSRLADLADTCALDIADKNGITLEEVGEIMNLTRERVRQVEVRGLLKLKMISPAEGEIGTGAD